MAELEKILNKQKEAIIMDKLSPEGKDVEVINVLTLKTEGKYEVNNLAGQGGMKEIYSVKDHDASRDIAMAVMLEANENGTLGRSEIARFIYEARIAANLEHPNICPVHDIGVDTEGNPYFTMKLIGGEDLQQIIDKIRTGNKEYAIKYTQQYLLEIFKKVCNAIAFAHSKGVIHLDLKPENIQVGEYGEVLVLDWGLAKLISEKEEDIKQKFSTEIYQNMQGSALDMTLDGVIKGTLGYMAPEQAKGENSKKDARTDIYGLGGILYAILTLECPIIERHVNLILKATMNGEIIPPTIRIPQMEISYALEAIAMTALSKKQENRYQYVNDLIKDLDAFTAGFATAAENATIYTQLFLFVKRHKIFVTTIFVAIIVTFTILIGFMYGLKQKERIAYFAEDKAKKSQVIAESALSEIKSLSEQTAPEFLTKALKDIDLQDWEEALKNAKIARTLHPEFADAWYQEGRINLALGNIKNAVIAFEKSEIINRLVKKAKAIESEKVEFDKETAALLADEAKIIKDLPLMIKLSNNNGEDNGILEAQLKTAFEAIKRLNPQQKKWSKKYIDVRVKKRAKKNKGVKTIRVNLNRHKYLKNIQPLKNLPINDLNLSYCPEIENIDSLKGMPITKLYLSQNNKINDYSVINEMPLKEFSPGNLFSEKDMVLLEGKEIEFLDLYYCRNIDDISALKGLPLKVLKISNSETSDISVLKGMPLVNLDMINFKSLSGISVLKGMKLKTLNLSGTKINDISALKGMPLETLKLSDTKIYNLSALKGMPLKYLRLDNCKELKNINILRTLKSLERVVLPRDLKSRMKHLQRFLPNLKK